MSWFVATFASASMIYTDIMSKRRSKQESKAAQRASSVNLDKKGDNSVNLDKKGAETQVRGAVGGAKTRAKVPAGAPRPKPAGPNRELTFGKQTYMFLGIGFALVLIGLLLMSGGRGTEYSEFDVNQIYSFRRITLAPVVILAGLGVVTYGIFKR